MRGPIAAALVLLAAPTFSGCLSASGDPSSEDAPHGPSSLRVGSTSWGEFERHTLHFSGTRLRASLVTGTVTPEPFEERWIHERAVADDARAARDRLLRDVDTVTYSYHVERLDGDPDGRRSTNFTRTYDLATEAYLFSEATATDADERTDCQILIALCETYDASRAVVQRYYPRLGTPARWGLLDGQVLHLGIPVTFERDVLGNEARFRLTQTLTPVREEVLAGERVFVVESRVTLLQIDPPVDGAVPQGDASGAVHLLYIGARLGLPVQETHRVPFQWDGETYWHNTDIALDAFEPGAAPIAWGERAPIATLSRTPGILPVLPKEFVAASAGLFEYPLQDAWAQVRADPALLSFQDYLDRRPQAWPYVALYVPDPVQGSYTWTFVVGDDVTRPYVIETRRQLLNPAPQVWAVQDRDAEGEDAEFLHLLRAPDSGLLAGLDLVPLADLAATYERQRTSVGPLTGVLLDLSTFANFRPTFRAQVHFFDAESRSGPGLLSQHWEAKNPVTLSLVDGGLVGLNLTHALVSGANQWPWVAAPAALPSLPSPTSGAALAVASLGNPAWTAVSNDLLVVS